MRTLAFTLLLIGCFAAAPLMAQESVDSQVAAALADIERYENQFAGQTSASASSINRTLKLLGLTRERLDSSPNQSDPSWIAADERYNALVQHLNAMLSPAAAAPATSPSSPSAASIAAPAETPPPPAAPSTPATSSAGQPQMISQQRVRINKLGRDIDSRMDTMDQDGVKPFQDPEYVAGLQRSLDGYKQSLAKYDEFAQDPDVIAVAEKVAQFENMVNFGIQHAQKESAGLGDVQAELARINQAMRAIQIPATPESPYAEGELNQWIDDLLAARNTAEQLYEPLTEIREKAHLPEDRLTPEQGGRYDQQDVDRLMRYLAGIPKTTDDQVNQLTMNLDVQMDQIQRDLEFFNAFDPTDRNDQSNHFLAEGRAEEVRAKLQTDYINASEAAAYSARLQQDNQAQRKALVEQVRLTQQQYEEKYTQARDLFRMPPAASTDSDLVEIAEETLAGYDYVGEIERLVINADKRHLSKETSEVQYDEVDVSLSGDITLSGTETTWFYEWDEFQVATAEAVGGTYYVFYNTLKYFTSGASNTPLNRWVIASRFQGSEIPEENIHKD